MQARQSPEQGTLVLTPVSPALAQLLHQVQQQIIREAECRAAAPDPFELQGPIVRIDSDDSIQWRGDNGQDQASRRRFLPEAWVGSSVEWHPSHWRVYRYRRDGRGREWSASSDIFVCDDFGNLVPAGAQ